MVKKKEKVKPKILRKVVARRVLRTEKKPTLTIKEHEPAEYVGRFFKDEMEETGKSMFFE